MQKRSKTPLAFAIITAYLNDDTEVVASLVAESGDPELADILGSLAAVMIKNYAVSQGADPVDVWRRTMLVDAANETHEH